MRRGLSTLEMVMALPILLFVMAAIINYGVVATWKVRALTVARHAAWGTRWPRSGNTDPRPENWPANASVGTGGGSIDELSDPRVDHPVVRGPTLDAAIVNRPMLEPAHGFRRGTGQISRHFPMLRIPPFHLEASTGMLDNKWEFPHTGQDHNRDRRIPDLYELPRVSADLVTAYVQAVVAILSAVADPRIWPLDKDEEFIYYNQLFGWGSGAPDFHPRVGSFCQLGHTEVDRLVKNLIYRIQGKPRDVDGIPARIPSLPERMAGAFIGLYQRAINEYQLLLNGIPPPPNPAAINAEIAQLQAKITTLQQFVSTLQQ
jgi:hypothetical protein